MKTTATTIKELLDKRRAREQDLQLAEYVEPLGVALHRVRLRGSQIEILVTSVVGDRTFAPGEIVLLGTLSGRGMRVILGLAPPGMQGASGFDSSPVESDSDGLAIVLASPADVTIGETTTVDFLGWGLRDGDSWAAVLIGSDGSTSVDPLIALGAVSLLDPVSEGYADAPSGWDLARVSVTVDSATPVRRKVSFLISRSTASHLAAEILTAVAPAVPSSGQFVGVLSWTSEAPDRYRAFEYSNATQGDEIGSILSPADPDGARVRNWQSIRHDPEASVADGSVAFCFGGLDTGDDSQIVVWEPSTEATHTYSPPAGFEVTGPLWDESTGALMWFEWEIARHDPGGGDPQSSTLRLMTATADLASPSTVATIELATAAEPTPTSHAVRIPRLTRDHAYCLVVSATDGNVYTDLRWPMSGGAPTDRSAAFVGVHEFLPAAGFEINGYGCRTGSAGGCEYWLKSSSSGSEPWLFHQATEIEEDSAPQVGAPALESWDMPTPRSIDYLAGSGVLVYSADGVALRGPIVSAPTASPLQVISPETDVDPMIAFLYRSA